MHCLDRKRMSWHIKWHARTSFSTTRVSHECLLKVVDTTRKPINTNENIEGIFSSVNFQGILPMDIFPRYIPRELQRDKKIKTKQKKMITCQDLPTKFIPSVNQLVNLFTLFIMSIIKGITDGKNSSVFSKELQDCSLSNCTVNCCSLRTKSPTDWKVVGVIWRFSEKIQLI